jgi:hypothetical protein
MAGLAVGQLNLAPLGEPIIGAGSDLAGTNDVPVVHFGPLSEVNDGVFNPNLAANGFTIDADGQAGANGNGVDTFAGGVTANLFDYVGVLFAEPQFGVTNVRVQNFLANDGGWWGSSNVVAGGVPLAAQNVIPPTVQVSIDRGATWSTVPGGANDYAAQYVGRVRGTGFPFATSGPFATFTFPEQNAINGIRLIGGGAGPADGNGFIGVNEFEVIGQPQNLTLNVLPETGLVQLANQAQTSIAFDYYQIASASGGMQLERWKRLEDDGDNPPGFLGGDGTGNGWEAFANLSSRLVAESYLRGASTLAPGESINLGYMVGGDVDDLELRYRTSAGVFVDVAATVAAGLAGDLDANAVVDGADFLAWQQNYGAGLDESHLADWQAAFGAAPATVSALPTPEPRSATMWFGAAAIRVLANSMAVRRGTPYKKT